MYRTDDPLADYDRYSAEQEAELEHYPVCEFCDQHITDEKLINVNGDLFHEDCFMKQHSEWTENHMW